MAVVRNIQNNVLYRYLGGNRFRNLCTGEEGVVDEEKAREVFKINLEATQILENYPNIEKMIFDLKLKADVLRVPAESDG